MAKNCVVIPTVKDKDGNIVKSRLFQDLLSYTENNRLEATRLYLVTKNELFIKNWNPRLTLDSNNEPTIASLLAKTNLNQVIPEARVLQRLNEEIGHFNKRGDVKLTFNTDENYQKLIRKAIQFNTTSEFRDLYVASVTKIMDTEGNRVYIAPVVKKKDRFNSINADNMTYNYNLNNRLRDILASNGVTIGALTDLELRRGVAGVTDFSLAKDAASGMIELIRLADGVRGEKALPEEFAHFALEALGDNPLATRLINNIAQNNLASEIIGDDYDTYNTLYDGNLAKLAKEAAGKLLAKHLLLNEEIKASPYKNLLERVISAIKSLFKTISANSILKAMYEADKDFGRLARDIINGLIDSLMDLRNIGSSELFYSTQERVSRDKNLLQGIINNELKRLKIYEKRNPNSQFSTNQRLLIDQLELELIDNNEIEGIYDFLDNALDELKKVSNRLTLIEGTPATNLNERASTLRDIRNYMYSYNSILKDIRESLREEERESDNRYGARVRVAVDNVSNLLNDLYVDYNRVAIPLFVDFIKPFLGENLVVPFGKNKGKEIRAEELIKIADLDISFFDRWLDSMSDSSDIMLKVMDLAVKKSKELARLRTIDISKKLLAAAIKLEQSGIKDTDWMFERDSKGNLTGNYITEINQGLYRQKMKEMFKSLEDKYGKNPIGEDAERYKNERLAWFDANTTEINGKKEPKPSIYGNQNFQRLNNAQKEYYNTVMQIKADLDSYLPDRYIKPNTAVQIRKDLLERVKSSDSVKSGASQIWENVKEQFIRRVDDTDFGDKATVKDFEGNEVQMLPVYFTKRLENPNDLSTDVTSTMIAYAAMANDFDEMNKVIDTLELGRDLLREREITLTRGEKPLVERFKSVGRTVESKLTKSGDLTRFALRLNDFFEMQVYGRYMADEGTFGKTNIDRAKVANFVNRMTSLNTLALNILSGVSNIATGKIMMRIESFAGEFYNEKNTITADRNYGKELPAYLALIGSRVKTNKLALWDELFNVMQEYELDVREVNFDRKTWFSRMFGSSSLFFMNNAGEHWMLNRTSLALADAYKMKAPNGKIVSLWDAFEVVPINPSNKALGAKLELKKGYKKADGSDFTLDDIIKFSRKSAAVNQRMHGIYNKIDRSAIQRLALGRMGMMFRKWMKPSFNRRFKSATYNYDLQSWTEGYYITTGKFLTLLARDLKSAQFNVAAHWNELTKTEQANIKRAITEVSHFLAIAAALGLIEWSDDRDRPWLVKMIEYQARRLYTEIGVMIPGKPMITEGLKIIKSPAAGVNTIENVLDLTNLINPWSYFDEIQSGRFKGHSSAYRSLFRSPLFPMLNTVERGIHPEEAIPFFKQ